MDKQVDAIGIGCRRCASSYLHNCLNQHPEIIKPNRGIHFFSNYAIKGKDWYLDKLPPKEINKVLLEFSVSYAYPEYAHLAAKHIKKMFPNVKLFVTVRNPIERAFSDYLRSIRNLEIPHTRSFEDAIDIYPEFLDRGRYSKVLSPYFDLFKKDQIHILIYEDLLKNTEDYLNPLYQFLGVQQNIIPDKIETKKEKRGELRWPILQSSLLGTKNMLDSSAEKFDCLDAWNKVKKKFRNSYITIRSINTTEAKMSDSIRKDLYLFYKNDIDWIKEKNGRELEGWG
jgi:hypothetical protein